MIARVSCTGISAWHVALTALDAGDLDGALAIYEQQIKPAGRPYPPLNIFTDGASLLWRLSLAGQAGWSRIGAMSPPMANNISRRPARISPTSTYALAAAAIGSDALETRLAQLEARAADGKLAPGRAAIDLCRGIRAFADRRQ